MASSVETMNNILNGSSSLNVSTSDREIATRKNMLMFTTSFLVQLRNAKEALLKGNDLVGPSSGYDKELDKINTDVSCYITNNNNTDMHDSYRCSSASQGIGIFVAMIESIVENIELLDGNFDNQKIAHALHLLNRHLLEKLELAVD